MPKAAICHQPEGNIDFKALVAAAQAWAGRIAKLPRDAIAFGKLFISNPDLPRRFREGTALNEWNGATFYAPGAAGYTDYPALG